MARVLIVEDSPTQAEEMRLLLVGAGYTVEKSSDGLEALKALRRATPDLVVTDLIMPGMDGIALVEAIRTDFPYVPVVLVTAFGSEQAAAHALRAGAASYVPKRDLAFDLVPTVADVLAVTSGHDDRRRILGRLERAALSFTLDNDLAKAAPAVSLLEEILATLARFDPTDVIRVGVALHEILVNAIEHGNLELDPALHQTDERAYRELAAQRRAEPPYCDRRVQVEAEFSGDSVSFVVRDEGPGFEPAAMSDLSNLGRLVESGSRGLLLVHTFMDEVRHNALGNEVTLVKRVSGH